MMVSFEYKLFFNGDEARPADTGRTGLLEPAYRRQAYLYFHVPA